jgi:hypothetical protein
LRSYFGEYFIAGHKDREDDRKEENKEKGKLREEEMM